MSPETTTPKSFPWKTAIISTTMIAFSCIVFLGLLKACNTIPEIAEKFKTGTITSTFTESVTQISATQGDVLEVGVIQAEESFQKTDSLNIAWDWIYLGTTVAEIRAPVTFRYHIRLSDPWRLATRDNVCLVLAPEIRASLPPAIHTDKLEKSSGRGWGRLNEKELLDELEKSITPTLEERAQDDKHRKLVREASRQSVAEFVKKWLMREDNWRRDRFTSIIVVFPDEVPFDSDEQLEQFEYKPSIDLEYSQ